jgi:hypothetical protein
VCVCVGGGGQGLSLSPPPVGPTLRAAHIAAATSRCHRGAPHRRAGPHRRAAPRRRRLPRAAPPPPHPAYLAVDLEEPWWRRRAEQQCEAWCLDLAPPLSLSPSPCRRLLRPSLLPRRGTGVRRASRPAYRGARVVVGGGRSHRSGCWPAAPRGHRLPAGRRQAGGRDGLLRHPGFAHASLSLAASRAPPGRSWRPRRRRGGATPLEPRRRRATLPRPPSTSCSSCSPSSSSLCPREPTISAGCSRGSAWLLEALHPHPLSPLRKCWFFADG